MYPIVRQTYTPASVAGFLSDQGIRVPVAKSRCKQKRTAFVVWWFHRGLDQPVHGDLKGYGILCRDRNSIKQHQTASNSIKQHQTASNSIKQHQTASNSIKQHQTASNSIKLHQTASNSIKQHQTASNSIKQHQTASNCIKLHQTASNSIKQHQTTIWGWVSGKMGECSLRW